LVKKPTGGKGVGDIEQERLAELNSGLVEAATLTECLAVDFVQLMRSALSEIGDDAIAIMEAEKQTGILKRMGLAGKLIRDRLGDCAFERLKNHTSDTVRGWACFLVGANDSMPLSERLA
jgi:hypothetical protein